MLELAFCLKKRNMNELESILIPKLFYVQQLRNLWSQSYKMFQKIFTFITAILENLIFSGAFFGWANIYPVLKDEKYFCDVKSCFLSNNETRVNATQNFVTQEEDLFLVFTISCSFGIFSAIFIGVFLDRFGMWATRTLLISIATGSYLIVANTTYSSSMVLYIAFPLISMAGFSLAMTNNQMANIFPDYRGLYSTFIQGAFSSASISYLLINKLYYAGYDFRNIIYVYAGAFFILNLRTFILTPRYSVPCEIPRDYSYGYAELCFDDSTLKRPEKLKK